MSPRRDSRDRRAVANGARLRLAAAAASAVAFAWLGPIAWLAPHPAQARSDGITSAFMFDGPSTCSGGGCHGDTSPLVAVSWTGPDVLAPGETALYELRMEELAEGGLLAGTGIHAMLFLDGEKLPFPESLEGDPDFPDSLQVVSGEVTHAPNVNLPPGGVGVFAYQFPVTAPEVEGTLELLGALNSFNQNLSSSGDHWERAELQIQVVPEPVGPAVALAALLAMRGAIGTTRFARRRAAAADRGGEPPVGADVRTQH